MIICNIINNKFDQAKLGLQLLKEQNQPGDIFFIDLAFSLMSEKDISESSDLKQNLDQVKELNPIIMSSFNSQIYLQILHKLKNCQLVDCYLYYQILSRH